MSRAATQLIYKKGSSYTKDVTTEPNSTSEIGVQSCIDVPICVLSDVLQRDQFKQQHQKNDIFYAPTVVNAQSFIGSEKYPDAGLNCIHTIHNFSSQAYVENVSCFRRSAECIFFFRRFIAQKYFEFSNDYPEKDRSGFNSKVFDVHHHQG